MYASEVAQCEAQSLQLAQTAPPNDEACKVKRKRNKTRKELPCQEDKTSLNAVQNDLSQGHKPATTEL
eukprot:9218823-Prorocentrum_lima.AAC.1